MSKNPKGGLIHRLYHGETSFPLIQQRKKFYAVSLILVVVALGSMVFRGFNLGVEFRGGNVFQIPNTAHVSVEDTRSFVTGLGIKDPIIQTVKDTSGKQSVQVTTDPLSVAATNKLANELAAKFKVDGNALTTNTTSSSWGSDVTKKAIEGLIVFLLAVSLYISLRFEPKMAAAAMVALVHDLFLAAGVYSVTGFVVTPSTIVALLTVLGYSLYDTIVVFDKVAENTRGLEKQTIQTYAEASELAVNQTFMRSINTSLIALLPVSGLLFVGAFLLGAGTLKDLALALFVGLASGAYSSLFLATPLLADFKEREPKFKQLHARVLERRNSGKAPVRLSQRSLVTPEGEVVDDAPTAFTPSTRRPPSKQQKKRSTKGGSTGKRRR